MSNHYPQSEIQVSAPSRLHFGFYSVGQNNERQFGGLGLVIQQPRTNVCVSNSHELRITADDPAHILTILQRWLGEFGDLLDTKFTDANQLPVHVNVQSAARHAGLGSGTQIAMAVSTALFHFFNSEMPDPQSLSVQMGRAGRSAIGSYGFFRGGFLVDRGVLPCERIAPLDLRLDFPTEWPVVLIIPERQTGLSGHAEKNAFGKLEATPETIRNRMISTVRDNIVPSIAACDYEGFAENLYHFGYQSGLHFSSIQNGAFYDTFVADIVKFVRSKGIRAVGQSSWGPCVFAIAPTQRHADELCNSLKSEMLSHHSKTKLLIIKTKADNLGVRIKRDFEKTIDKATVS